SPGGGGRHLPPARPPRRCAAAGAASPQGAGRVRARPGGPAGTGGARHVHGRTRRAGRQVRRAEGCAACAAGGSRGRLPLRVPGRWVPPVAGVAFASIASGAWWAPLRRLGGPGGGGDAGGGRARWRALTGRGGGSLAAGGRGGGGGGLRGTFSVFVGR